MPSKYLIALSIFSSCLIALTYCQESADQRIRDLQNAVRHAGCQRYVAHGYRYEHMYPLNTIYFDNTLINITNKLLVEFEMHIAVKAEKDGLILLSPLSEPGPKDLVFEIGVGIASNQYTILRINKDSSNEVARVFTPNIISDKHYTNFYISIAEGSFTFGKEGEDPIISYLDTRLSSIKYFDVSCWGSAYATFLYDCPHFPEW